METETFYLKQSECIEELGIDGLKILQSDELYRFTSDAIMLSKFASAKKNERLADFCSGSGIVALHFYALHSGIVESADLFEIQPSLAQMSERSIALNKLEGKFTVHNTPLQEIGREFDGAFSLVLCNPPYERAGTGEANADDSTRIARHEVAITLDEIITIAAKKLKFGGRLCMCHRADRLADIICSMRASGIEPKRIRYAGAKSKPPYLVFLEGVRGGKPGMITELPFEN